jgi:hypothetical protein
VTSTTLFLPVLPKSWVDHPVDHPVDRIPLEAPTPPVDPTLPAEMSWMMPSLPVCLKSLPPTRDPLPLPTLPPFPPDTLPHPKGTVPPPVVAVAELPSAAQSLPNKLPLSTSVVEPVTLADTPVVPLVAMLKNLHHH